uniref:Uncharacterized protein n=1 Tax=Triticum urartu TaxID=4572 RepID=A0A8R7QNX6_TRIUA
MQLQGRLQVSVFFKSCGSPARLADAPLFSSKHRDPWARSVQQLTGSSGQRALGRLSYGFGILSNSLKASDVVVASPRPAWVGSRRRRAGLERGGNNGNRWKRRRRRSEGSEISRR